MATRRPRGSAMPMFCECGDHAFANLTKGFVALVSPADAGQFYYHWHAVVPYPGYVMVSRAKSLGHQKNRTVVLAREILGITGSEKADHKSGNTLDNRRSNIRKATARQNSQNKGVHPRSKSGLKGVNTQRGRFYAKISIDGKVVRLGGYPDADQAFLAYAVAAYWFHGEFARVA